MSNVNKIILGIDPGTARMGWGIIEHINSKTECVEYGTLTTEPQLDDHLRLFDLYMGLEKLIKKYNPALTAVEDIFYFKNQKTIVSVSQARGVALLAAARNGSQCHSFTPLQIKQAVVGYGHAEKRQVQEMVKSLLDLDEIPRPDDAADALAVAICCAYSATSLLGM